MPLSASTAARLAGISRPERAQQLLLGRLLLLHAARITLSPQLTLADIAEHPDGYPWLPDWPDSSASLSHSGEILAVALNPDGACGLDIEQQRPRNVLRLAEKFCATDQQELAALDSAAQLQRFYLHWTLREAAYKGGWRAHVVGEPAALHGDADPLPGWDSVLFAPALRCTLVWPGPCQIDLHEIGSAELLVV